MPTFRAVEVPLIQIPVISDALQAEVVPTGNSCRIPEKLSADSTREAVYAHGYMRLCHVCVKKGGILKLGFDFLHKTRSLLCGLLQEQKWV